MMMLKSKGSKGSVSIPVMSYQELKKEPILFCFWSFKLSEILFTLILFKPYTPTLAISKSRGI